MLLLSESRPACDENKKQNETIREGGRWKVICTVHVSV